MSYDQLEWSSFDIDFLIRGEFNRFSYKRARFLGPLVSVDVLAYNQSFLLLSNDIPFPLETYLWLLLTKLILVPTSANILFSLLVSVVISSLMDYNYVDSHFVFKYKAILRALKMFFPKIFLQNMSASSSHIYLR